MAYLLNRRTHFFDNDNSFVLKEYIEGTGTQYVDLDVTVSTASHKIVYDTHIDIVESVSQQWIFGRPYCGFGAFGLEWADFGGSITIGKTYHLILTVNNGVATLNIDGVDSQNSADWSNHPQDGAISLFRLYGTSGPYGRCRFRKMKILIDDVLTADIVPGLKDGTPCVKDKISGNYYYNNGSGSFTYA